MSNNKKKMDKISIGSLNISRLSIVIIMLLVVVVGGTFAWFTYRSSETALVLSIGDINDSKVIINPYQIKKNMVPSYTYNEDVYSQISVITGSSDSKDVYFELYYLINQLDENIIDNGLKYTIMRSSSVDGEYIEVSTGDFKSISDSKLIILNTEITSGTNLYYRVYPWIDSSVGDQSNIQNSYLDIELNANVRIVDNNAILTSYSCNNTNFGVEPYSFTYTGDCEVVDDGDDNWRVRFLTDGEFKSLSSLNVDIFLVGGGGGGTNGSNGGGRAGGGGGYTTSKFNVNIIGGTTYNVIVGNGGSGSSATYEVSASDGESSSFGDLVSVDGGQGGRGTAYVYTCEGGSGGSGGAGGAYNGAGGANGFDGEKGYHANGGKGQGYTTGEFGVSTNTNYSGGGGSGDSGGAGGVLGGSSSGVGESGSGVSAAANTGGGGGGGSVKGGDGGSGIVIIRNSRKYDIKYNANGGIDVPENQIKIHDIDLTLSTTKPSRDGYIFLGWSTSPTGTYVIYKGGDNYTLNASITLYAVWVSGIYEINYNSNLNQMYFKDSVIAKLGGRTYYKKTDGSVLAGYVTGNGWTSPVLVGTTADSVRYYAPDTNVCSDITYDGTFIYDNVKYYYSGPDCAMTNIINEANTTLNYYSYTDLDIVNANLKAAQQLVIDSFTIDDWVSYNTTEYIYNADSLIVTLSGRSFYKRYSGPALVAYTYRDSAWTGPVLVSDSPDAVAYYTSVSSSTFIYTGSFEYNGKMYYYSSDGYWMSGNLDDTSGLNRTKYTGSIAEVARELVEKNNIFFVKQRFAIDINQNLISNPFVKNGATFYGWSTSPFGYVEYEEQQSVKNLASNNDSLELYAIWGTDSSISGDHYTISYDANGGSGAPSAQMKVYGINLILSSLEPTRDGYTFLGWSIYSDASSAMYSAESIYTSNESITLYAVWQIDSP